MEKKKVRIGFVGVGNMGQCAHLKNYATLEDCEVAALAELRSGLAQKVAARYGVKGVYSSHKEMLKAEKLDAIVAVHSFGRHGILVPELLAARVPVLTEKPLASSIDAGKKIVKAVQKSGTFLMIGYHKRSDPATMLAKERIEELKTSGELGKMKYVRILMPAGDWIAEGFSDLIRTDEPYPEVEFSPPPRDMDEKTFQRYEAFVNYYIHQVNLMRHMLGEPYKVRYADRSGVLFVGESRSGVTCAIEMSPYETTIDWQESALVAFERGYVKLYLPAPLASNRPGRVEIFKDPGGAAAPQTIVPQLPWIHAMRQQAINFVRAVRGEIRPLCEAAEALEDLKVAREYIRLLLGR